MKRVPPPLFLSLSLHPYPNFSTFCNFPPINSPPKISQNPNQPTIIITTKFLTFKFQGSMADIAMLVAEEYERRVRSAKKAASASAAGGGGGSGGLLDYDEHRRSEMVYTVAQGLKHKFDEVKSQILSYNWIWEPRTQFSVAASHSFFSA